MRTTKLAAIIQCRIGTPPALKTDTTTSRAGPRHSSILGQYVVKAAGRPCAIASTKKRLFLLGSAFRLGSFLATLSIVGKEKVSRDPKICPTNRG